MEWRCHRNVDEIDPPQMIQPHEYKILIHDSNLFHPIITGSMKENCENLAEHLTNILRLKIDVLHEEYDNTNTINGNILDKDIIDCATHRDLSIFVSIDGIV